MAGERRALTQVGGPARVAGDPSASRWLASAVAVERPVDRLTHGFHTYPARLHPDTAARLLADLPSRAVVLDPFAGSATVLVEGLVAGLATYGSDLSPLAVRLARLKTWRSDPPARERLTQTARAVAERSFARVRGRVPVRAALSRQDAAWYPPHVLMELAGLLEEIRREPAGRIAEALELCFSAILVKVSSRRADTRAERVERRIRKGLATELFGARVLELGERLGALQLAVPAGTPDAVVVEADARKLADVPVLADLERRVHRIVTSPPYGGTYDYAGAQALRAAWLGLDDRRYQRSEIGARRAASEPDAAAQHERDLAASLARAERLLRPDGTMVLVLGDARWAGRIVGALEMVRRIAPAAGLRVVASASQSRRDFFTDASDFDRLPQGREEHAILLDRAVVRVSRPKN